MSKTFNIKIEGLKDLVKKLGKATAQETIEKPMFLGALNMASWSKEKRLTGPRPKFLGVVSGRLRSSLSVSRSIEREKFKFFIGTNVKYAKFHELGFKGRLQVKEHIRRFKKKVSFKTFIVRPGSLVAEEKRKRKTIFSGYAHVKPYTKTIDYKGRPFIQPSVENERNINKMVKLISESITKALST